MSLRSPVGQDYINTEVINQPWYQGSLERREAETRLRDTPHGTYLVRFSNTQQKYVISIRWQSSNSRRAIEVGKKTTE